MSSPEHGLPERRARAAHGAEEMRIFDPNDTGRWCRVHPASPVVRGWLAIVAIAVVFGRNFLEQLFSQIGPDWQIGSDRPLSGVDFGPVWLTLLMLLGVMVVICAGFALSWYFTRFQITSDHVRVNSGVIFRQQRQARIDRVQAIDVVQPLLARIFGLAELKFEVAQAGGSLMRLAFLTIDDAQRLRAYILARAAAVPVAGPEQPGAEPSVTSEIREFEVLRLPSGRILASVVLSWVSVVAVLLAVVLIWLASHQLWGALIALLPLGLGLLGVYWQRFAKEFDFRIAVSSAGVRLHYGLVETRSQTIPPGRVQAVGIDQDPLWRVFGWYRVRVNVAGYGMELDSERCTVLPVGVRQDVLTVLSLIFPNPGVENPERVFAAGLSGSGPAEGFHHSPPSARWLDPLAWKRNAYRVTATALLCRHGVLFRQLQVVPHVRTQSLQLRQGPWQRLLGLVSIALHSTPGPVRPVVRHLGVRVGRELFAEQADRATQARRLALPERWMYQEGERG